MHRQADLNAARQFLEKFQKHENNEGFDHTKAPHARIIQHKHHKTIIYIKELP